ncbi:MAG: hypothetical protein HN509_02690 [Halobacteriovoraceae bacterium]|nr:hypothetical protein [Halobacteriovoraceae bacterium]
MIKKYHPLLLTALFLTTLGVLVRFTQIPEFQYSLWMDRDLYRALNFSGDWWFLGPELTQAGRTPGGFFYLLLHLLTLLVGSDLILLNSANVLFQVIGLWFLYLGLRYFLRTETAAILVSQICCGYIYLDYSQVLWHPGLAFLPFCISFYIFVRFLVKEETRLLVPLFFLVSVLAQFHLSYLILLFVYLLPIFLLKSELPKKYLLFSLLAFIAGYLPYLYYEFQNGFINSLSIFSKGVSLSQSDYFNYFFERLSNFVQLLSSFLGLVVGSDQTPTGIGFNERAAVFPGKYSFLFNLVFKFLTSFLVGLFLLAVYYNRKFVNRCRKPILLAFAIGFLLSICLFFLSPKSYSLGFRRYIFLVPFIYSLVGIYFEETKINSIKRFAVPIFLVLGLCNIAYFYLSLSKVHPSYQLKKEIAKTSFEKFGIGQNDFYKKVGYLGSMSGSFSIDENESGFHYILEENKSTTGELPCLFVVLGYDLSLYSKAPPEILQNLKKHPGLKKIDFIEERVHLGKLASYLPYRPIHGNCINTRLSNPYLLYGDKIKLEGLKKDLTGTSAILKIPDSNLFTGSIAKEGTETIFFSLRYGLKEGRLSGALDTTPLALSRYMGREISSDFLFKNAIIVLIDKSSRKELIKQPLIPSDFQTFPFIPPYYFDLESLRGLSVLLELRGLKGEKLLGPFDLQQSGR